MEAQTEIITTSYNIVDLVGAIVGANGQIPLAVERLRHKGIAIDAERLVMELASDNVAQDMIAKQFRLKATLTTYHMLMTYQATLIDAVDNPDAPLSSQGAVQGFSAISALFNNLTENRSSSALNFNVFDKVLSVLPPEARDALATLAVSEPSLPPPTPIRKRGRPPLSSKQLTIEETVALAEPLEGEK